MKTMSLCATMILMAGSTAFGAGYAGPYNLNELSCSAPGSAVSIEIQLDQPSEGAVGRLTYYSTEPELELPDLSIVKICTEVPRGGGAQVNEKVLHLQTDSGTYVLSMPTHVPDFETPKASFLMKPDGQMMECQFLLSRSNRL